MRVWTILLFSSGLLASPAPYRATETGNNLEVVTPQGGKLFIGDLGFDSVSNYRLEIPLNSFGSSDASAGQGASRNADKAPNPDQLDDDRLVTEANRLYNQGKFAEARAMVDALLQRNPNHVRGWMMRGSLNHVQGQRGEARQAWSKALQLDPGNTQVRNLLEKYR